MKDKDAVLNRVRELISARNPKDNRQAKRLAMRENVKLKKLRREFCQSCFHPLDGKTRINRGYKIVKCKNCGKTYRFRIS